MSPHDPREPDTGDDDELLAAECALGVLDAVRWREAQARIERDPAFADEVLRWEARFAPWLDAVAPVPPPAALWPRIRGALWGQSTARSDRRPPLWQHLPFWRGLAVGGLAATAASLALLFLTLQRPAPTPPAPPVVVQPPPAAPLVVSLRNENGSTAYTATLDPVRGTLVLVPVQPGGDPSLARELWLIPAGDKPHSLGMVARDAARIVQIPTALRGAAPGATFAISLEPAGSGPHAAPTGPVVATGSPVRL